MAYGYNLRQAPFGFPVVNPWPQGFQPAPPAPIAPQPQQDPMMGGGAPGGVPAQGGPMFPGLAARFPRLAQAGQAARGFVENFETNHPRVANFSRNNSDTLSNLGMALLTTRPGDNAPVREAYYSGRQSDQQRRAEQTAAEQEAEANRIWGQFLGGGQPQTGAPQGGGAAPGEMEPYRNAIGQIESGNNYTTVGPPADDEGHRAYGRYQVMDYNVGPWTQQVLGRSMTPQEFLADTAAQDRVFDTIFGGYIQQYGEDGAAQAWFGGPGSVGSGGGGSDVLGTTGTGYIAQYRNNLGQGGQAPAPAGGGQPQGRFTPQEQAQLQAMLSNPQTAGVARQIIAERMFAQGGEPFTLGANETRYGAQGNVIARGQGSGGATRDETRNGILGQLAPTGEWTPFPEWMQPNAGAPDPTAEQRDYDFYVQQETAAGRAPKSYNEWDLERRGRMGGIDPTIGEQRYNLLYQNAARELPVLQQTFASLSQLGNQAANQLPDFIANWLTTPDYQVAFDAVTQIVQMQTYALTGAAATESEARRIAITMLPAIGDSAPRLTQKWLRIVSAVEQMRQAGGAAAVGTQPFNADPLGLF